jgi:hypothetical protein
MAENRTYRFSWAAYRDVSPASSLEPYCLSDRREWRYQLEQRLNPAERRLHGPVAAGALV